MYLTMDLSNKNVQELELLRIESEKNTKQIIEKIELLKQEERLNDILASEDQSVLIREFRSLFYSSKYQDLYIPVIEKIYKKYKKKTFFLIMLVLIPFFMLVNMEIYK